MKIRFGIIGCGFIATKFADALAHSNAACLYAAAARDPEKAKKFADTYGAEKSYGRYEDLIADPDVDAVYIATVNSTHAGIAKMCIAGGKPLICEKPFFMSTEEAKEVIEAARKAGVLIMEGMWSRCLPTYHKVKEWIGAGRIGDVKLIRGAFCFPMPYTKETEGYRLFHPEIGGGSWLDVGVYPYEYITGIMGSKPDQIRFLKEMGPTGVDLSVAMVMSYDSGTIASCMSSIAGYMNGDAVIGGSQGYIVHKDCYESRRCELYDNRDNLLETMNDPVENGFVHEIRHFCDMLAQGKTESDNIPLQDTLDFTGTWEELIRE